MQNILGFLVKIYLKSVLGDFSEISHYEIDFCKVYVKLHKISIEIEMILKIQEELKPISLTLSVGLSLTSLIIFY